ncbi:HAMP domain-containing histidine kinase [Mordavella massiliensis]|uniref:histidine kinase n=1 Tax=Mordavella massiliensis TaxID=1871024 RepID=A0A938X9Y2_9CLOT|nr:HAMP domain-containing sensor histidine kinase [Mordavella massiliensis]MBM6947187.1 HAMP domain-containing histidine kinase [Mordavella massiliensis]
MKSNYRKLKFSILLQTVLVTALTVLVGGFLLNFVIDGVYNDTFAAAFVRILESFHVEEQTAIDLYWKLIGDNKVFFMIVGFLLLFALFFYVALSKMTRYLDQVGDGIENIISESTEPIHLITELKPIEIRLNEIKATLKRQDLEAIESEKKKNDLVLFLAHDLKTPLTSVVAYLAMLDAHPDMPEAERAKYVHISLEKAIRLGELINEFFDITKFNLQDIELEPVELNLSMMLEQIADELYGVLQEKKLSCEVETEDDLVIRGDPDKLARVFDNILRNAIAYCYSGTTIRISACQKNGDVEITFANQGKKIPGTKLQTIFEKFYRLDDSRSSETGGAGLGLAIAKEIVELHGGRIMAKSDDEKTQFIVTLPSGEEQEEKEEHEVHTHRRRAFGGAARGRKGLQRKPKRGDMGDLPQGDTGLRR